MPSVRCSREAYQSEPVLPMANGGHLQGGLRITIRRRIGAAVVVGSVTLMVLAGTSASAASTTVTRGACDATLSNTADRATSTVDSSCATSASSFWVRRQATQYVGGAPILVWISKGYHSGNGTARSPISNPLVKSEHRITNGAVADPGYTYTLVR